jgi:hypothetical protein
MRTVGLVLTASLACAGIGCGATTSNGGAVVTPTTTTVANIQATFMTRDNGKDEDSAVAVQLLDDSGRLAAEATVADLEFKDQSVSQPVSLSAIRQMPSSDLNESRVRLRLTPDGDDEWTFDLRLVVGLSDGTQRTYFWSGLRLADDAPERVLPLSSGRLP